MNQRLWCVKDLDTGHCVAALGRSLREHIATGGQGTAADLVIDVIKGTEGLKVAQLARVNRHSDSLDIEDVSRVFGEAYLDFDLILADITHRDGLKGELVALV